MSNQQIITNLVHNKDKTKLPGGSTIAHNLCIVWCIEPDYLPNGERNEDAENGQVETVLDAAIDRLQKINHYFPSTLRNRAIEQIREAINLCKDSWSKPNGQETTNDRPSSNALASNGSNHSDSQSSSKAIKGSRPTKGNTG